MNRIIIKDQEKETYVEYKNAKYCGYSFYNNGKIKSIDSSFFDMFNEFILSNNQTKLNDIGKYQVILDNETGFKHYFLDGLEDYVMFFNNNGSDATRYVDNESNKESVIPKKAKRFKIGKKVIEISCIALVTLMTLVGTMNAIGDANKYLFPKDTLVVESKVDEVIVEDLTVDEIINNIYSSNGLTIEEKNFLANRDFITDILPFINASNVAKYNCRISTTNITIKVSDDDSSNGYCVSNEPNVIYINRKLYEEARYSEKYYDVLAHEFIHLFQAYGEGVAYEAMAEDLSEEHYGTFFRNYEKYLYNIRKLMEIIGPKPVMNYVTTDKIDYIIDEIKDYLSPQEIEIFIDNMRYEMDEQIRKSTQNKLSSIIDTLYERKFGKSVSDDPVISHINEVGCMRYYLNKREKSYLETITKYHGTLKEAMENGLIVFRLVDKDGNVKILSYDEYMNDEYDMTAELYCYRYIEEEVKIVFDGDNMPYLVSTKIEYLPSVEEKINELMNQSNERGSK